MRGKRQRSYVRLIFPLDGSQPVEQLVRLLAVALDGQRPVERDALDTEYFVDGSVQFRDAEVRVRLSVCAFGDCRVIHSWSGTYATALGATLIAGLVADAVAPHVKLDADLKAPQD